MKKEIQNVFGCIEYSLADNTVTGEVVDLMCNYIMDQEVPAAALSVYPSNVEVAGMALGESPVRISAFCGAYPVGHSYLEVKLLECAMAIENGADEIEIMVDLASAIGGNYDALRAEIEAIKSEIAGEALLKVCVACELFDDQDQIYDITMAAIEAGADFIVATTAFDDAPSLPMMDAVLCAIKDYHSHTGVRVGLKFNLTTIELQKHGDDLLDLVKNVLGFEWFIPSLMRLDATNMLSYEPDEEVVN
ncbi:MAG: hypothetical protein R3Y19_04730 [Rikenellaceae bacterium]